MEDRKIRIMRKALKMYGVEDEAKQNSFMDDLTAIDKEEPQDNSSKDENTNDQKSNGVKAGENPTINENAKNESDDATQKKANDGVVDEKKTNGVDNKENPQADSNGQVANTNPIQQPSVDNDMKALQDEIASLKSQIVSVQGMLRDLSTNDTDDEGYDDGSRLGGNKIVPPKAKDEDTDGQDLVAKLGGGKY